MRSKRNRTKYICADTSKCKACWDCIDEYKQPQDIDFANNPFLESEDDFHKVHPWRKVKNLRIGPYRMSHRGRLFYHQPPIHNDQLPVHIIRCRGRQKDGHPFKIVDCTPAAGGY